MQDTRQRRAICRAYNVFAMDQFRPLADRIIPAAIIPMYTPEEAIEELDYAVTQLGSERGGARIQRRALVR